MRIKSKDIYQVIPKLRFPIDESFIPEEVKPILEKLFNSLPQLAEALSLVEDLAVHVCKEDYRREIILHDPAMVSYRQRAQKVLNDDPLAILSMKPPPHVPRTKPMFSRGRF